MEEKITIIIADDHDLVRQGLEAIIGNEPDFEILGTCSSGVQAIEMVAREQPDIMVMDIIMPGLNGIDAAVKIKSKFPEVRILMLSMEVSSKYIKTAFQSNIEGYIPKNADVSVLVEAIRTICKGERYYDERVRDYIFKFFVGEESVQTPKVENLSDREVQVLKLIADGTPNKEIGETLFISAKTVEAHRNNILRKLHLRSTADLVKFSIAKRITEIPKDMI